MHTVERRDALLAEARRRGYHVRLEWLGGQGGGVCELRGRKLLMVDLALDPGEQLEQALAALQEARTPLPVP